MKIALINDTHIGCRNDGQDFLDNQIRFFKEVFFPTLEKEKVEHVIHGGDLVDRRKYVNFKTAHELNKVFIDPIVSGGYKTTLLVGNHDVFYRNTNEINALRVLIKNPPENLTIVDHNPQSLSIDGVKFLLVPWITSDNQDACMKAIAEAKESFCYGHFEISGFTMSGGTLCTHGLDKDIFKKFEGVWSGHFHEPSEYGNIKYLGSPFEMTWSDHNGKRGFHIFDTKTRELTFYNNPYRMFHKIYYDDDDLTLEDVRSLDLSAVEGKSLKLMVRRKENPYVFDILIDRLNEAGPTDIKIVDETNRIIHEEIEDTISEAEDTPTIIKKYIKNIDVKVDKDLINELLQDLYRESNY